MRGLGGAWGWTRVREMLSARAEKGRGFKRNDEQEWEQGKTNTSCTIKRACFSCQGVRTWAWASLGTSGN